jgi:hypothetical protein
VRTFVLYNDQGGIEAVAKVDVIPPGYNDPFGPLAGGRVIELPRRGTVVELPPHAVLTEYEVVNDRIRAIRDR